ncbi:MAG: pantoate--beta-alanine ligase [Bacteroidetes bacterium]|nr:MAG: pantoate--beta-alanine ligase [Bacteroidota bacterium]REK55402.1 MAG: pantoate--beta-alanine ligase [Bacteroidota bacterium]
MTVLRSLLELNEWRAQIGGQTLGFVPTMGALHQGHISLVEQSLSMADHTLVSIYVNPTQFNNAEDLEKYPSTLEQDLALLRATGKVVVYLPTQNDLYPNGLHSRNFDFGALATFMEGAGRPGHFEGMATVVTRFFEIIRPDRAFFGEKDYQQLAIIKHVVANENWPVEIIACATLREDDGLAMSSRNLRLSAEQRSAAKEIHRIISQWISDTDFNTTIPQKERIKLVENINSIDHLEVEYLEFSASNTLTPVERFDLNVPTRVFAAVLCGKVRLIDNLPLF